ncbi:BEL1-like homeodomain protein 1 [Malania oleifera]|uniref:BEL1-like homeodomain protein 1 n=1 Tax=Malania oleifera TaxID=397392 RepID=UPI0025AEA230|nr:BEL1-like homeodomain protein 1 [Malania oleifera]XP_057973746.1 BEL1-like homeodomain protein 1 [Malania oleifera]XP_057973754.1 BEL1-like homeodomain protein 1 [Malania oleifera]XP_057973763.1 BEL1-like homeodomain protein 1 [Malania oleifera]
MATYFHGNSEIQGDGLQTLILMNPGYVGYNDSQSPAGNFVFLNSTGNSLNPPTITHALPSHTQQFVGVPVPSAAASAPPHDPNSSSVHAQHEISTLPGFLPRAQYNIWNSIDPTAAAREVPRSQQGLSLSLSSQQPAYGSPAPAVPPASSGDNMRISGGSSSSASGITNGVSGMQSVLLSSKYLKAAQQLLDEVVNVGGGIKTESTKGANGQNRMMGESSAAVTIGEGLVAGEAIVKRSAELTTAERQEIQMKKAKLVTMLEEVEQRYRQYHHQMQIVITTFEQVAGIGSAKTYTALALQTISKQFRCLKDAISGQIRAANKSLGEEDSLGGKSEGSRLKFVDNQLRQQRALQQLGMIQHNAWRPQRGLPERSVSVLRAWLFEHFLHPYPKDSDKHMLAKQTGLTRSQVSNWFINARVRLWKPMVEEMYLEEIKEHEHNQSDDKTSKSELQEDSTSKSTAQQEKNPVTETQNNAPPVISMSAASASPAGGGTSRSHSGFTLTASSGNGIEGIAQGSPKKPRSSTETLQSPNSVPSMDMDVKPSEANVELMSMKFGGERQSRDEYSLMSAPANFIGGFGSYPIGEIGRFDTEQFHPRFSGNAVSLTLGLPHCENLSLSGAHHNFLPNQNIQLGRRVEIGEPDEFGNMSMGMSMATPAHSTAAYDSISIQNRKRFAAQLLPDFVA